MPYTGPSIVDYLKSVGQPSDINSRIALGKKYGIDYSKSTTNYAAENTQLLNILRGGAAGTTTTGEYGEWVDPTTGLGYSGAKRKTTDVPAGTYEPTTAPPEKPPPEVPPEEPPPEEKPPIISKGPVMPHTPEETKAMDEIIAIVERHKKDYPLQEEGYREWLIDIISTMEGGKYSKYKQFIIDTIYRELRGEKEPTYEPPSWEVYVGTSEVARTKEEETEVKEGEEAIEMDEEIALLTRKQQLKNLRTELGLDPDTGEPLERPALPTFTSDFDAFRSEYGLEALESQINNLDAEMRDREASLRAGLYEEEGKLRPMELIGTRQRELTRQAQEAMDELTRRKAVLVDEYNTKVGVINTAMNLKEMDYNAAVADYNSRFNEQIALLNVIEARETREEQEENRERDDARANLTLIQNMIVGSGKTYDELDEDLKVLIKKEEAKADLPVGITEAFIDQKPEVKILSTTTGTDSEGNQIVTFIYQDEDGMPGVVKTVKTGVVKKSEEAEKIEDWDKARQFIDDNPDAPYETLYTYIQQYTGLNDTDTKAALAEKGKTPKEKEFITAEYFYDLYTNKQLSDKAKEVIPDQVKFTNTEADNASLYVKYLLERLVTLRNSGYSDKDIIKMLSLP